MNLLYIVVFNCLGLGKEFKVYKGFDIEKMTESSCSCLPPADMRDEVNHACI